MATITLKSFACRRFSFPYRDRSLWAWKLYYG